MRSNFLLSSSPLERTRETKITLIVWCRTVTLLVRSLQKESRWLSKSCTITWVRISESDSPVRPLITRPINVTPFTTLCFDLSLTHYSGTSGTSGEFLTLETGLQLSLDNFLKFVHSLNNLFVYFFQHNHTDTFYLIFSLYFST